MSLCHENEAETGRITVEKHLILRALAPTGVEARCVTVSPLCLSVAPFAGYNTSNFGMAKVSVSGAYGSLCALACLKRAGESKCRAWIAGQMPRLSNTKALLFLLCCLITDSV
jgi:hypothetical protein